MYTRVLFIILFGLYPLTTQAQDALCGNNILDAGELCDDGNTEDGDLCAANCLFGAPSTQTTSAPSTQTTSAPSTQSTFAATPTKSPRPLRAFALTLSSSVFTLGLSPSLGHLYAGERERAIKSWGIRMASESAMYAGGFIALVSFLLNSDHEGETRCRVGECVGGAMFFGGFTVGLGTLVFDVIDAPLAAAREKRAGGKPWPKRGWFLD